MKMKNSLITVIIVLILVSVCLIAGCSKYADPELKIGSNLTKITDDPATGNITYDLLLTVTNTGDNNAYQVKILAILSTPKDLPEYRFVNANINVGDVRKGEMKTFTERMTLPATRANYDLITSGSRQPEVETKLTSVTSNVMG